MGNELWARVAYKKAVELHGQTRGPICSGPWGDASTLLSIVVSKRSASNHEILSKGFDREQFGPELTAEGLSRTAPG